MNQSSRAILLVNLGSPDSPSVPDVRRYLAEFLMDPCVLDIPWLLRFFLVYGAILPTRPKASAAAYQKIWTEKGSPLITISKDVQTLLQEKISDPVFLAMRYGQPSIENVLKEIKMTLPQLKDLYVIPLYPQFAMSSYQTVEEKVREQAQKILPKVTLDFKPPFYNDGAYLEALADLVEPYTRQGYDRILFSFHGLPERHLKKADPTKIHCLNSPDCCRIPSPARSTCYKAQAVYVVDQLAKKLSIPEGKFQISFQSRLGKDPWIKPYTDEVLTQLPSEGVKKLLVLCPAFVSDCLETLEEIEKEGKKVFLQSGGESFTMIPCLNTHPAWIASLVTWCTSPDQARKTPHANPNPSIS